MSEYTDFELLIERTGNGYRARVLASPVGTGAGPVFDLPSLTFGEQEPGETRHVQIIGSPGRISTGGLGRRLFQAVFSGQVLGLWQGSLGRLGRQLRLRIRLEDDPYLLNIPWELLDDPDRGVIATESPVVRIIEGPFTARHLIGRSPLRILAVLSCPPDMPPLDMDEEWRILDRMLGPLVADEQVVMEKLVQPTPQRLRRVLEAEEWHVLHFVGHGLSGAVFLEGLDGGAWAVGYETLGVLFFQESLRLVVLNACEGARPGEHDPFSGVAQALVRRGVPAVLAMQQQVSDKTAISFAEHFYRALALSRRFQVDVALKAARRELYSRNDPEWAVPVLYLSAPDGDLVELIVPRPFCPERLFWILAALSVIGGLLAAFALGYMTNSPAPSPPGPPPRTSAENPRGCSSPEGLDISFVRIEPSIFRMGQEKGEDLDEPVHEVSITRAFCLGAFEVTQEQWAQVMGVRTPKDNEKYLPASKLSFQEVQDFFDRLNKREKVEGLYRLPTEAEWELAARARSETLYSFGDDESALGIYGNCRGEGGLGKLAPVGSFEPNQWGLYDMYGNVSEWVSDWYGSYSGEPVKDPRGPLKGEKRIRRGGSWDSDAKVCSSADRRAVKPTSRFKDTGFRIVREIR